jgi:mannose-6-phosphate isomerase-like protein (cupin superfamily)
MAFDLEIFLKSGIIEEYCSGVLSPGKMEEVETLSAVYSEIKAAIRQCEEALELYASGFAVEVPPHVKIKTMELISNLAMEDALSLTNLPLINPYSDANKWLKFAKPLLPLQTDKSAYFQVLRNDTGIFQSIVWVKENTPDEVHRHERESFLILEGTCECHIGKDTYKLSAGDFLEIPLNMHHDVILTSPEVLAILQRVAV